MKLLLLFKKSVSKGNNKLINYNILVMALIVGFIITCFVGIYSNTTQANIANKLIRLHVIANSDSKEDQELKLRVRDAIINGMTRKFESSSSILESKQIVLANLDNIKGIAEDVIRQKGYNYDVKVGISNSYFPTKYYENISLPAGNYEALKVEIGSSKGANWWCVLFPPLCFVDSGNGELSPTSKQTLKNSLSTEEYDLITSGSSSVPVKVKFKSVEMFQKSKHNIEVAINKMF